MIVDAFMFNDEFDMLDIHLAITDSYVDRWIILEGNRTWSGIPKPYNLQNCLDKYAKYADRIQLISLDIPDGYINWQCENYSRASLQQGIDCLDDKDIILHGDLDEILDPTKFNSIIDLMDLHDRPVNCSLEMFIYRFDQQTDRRWSGNVVARKHMFDNPQQLYKGINTKKKDRSHCVVYPDTAGWHWTWIGSDQRIRSKVASCIESQHRDPEQVLSSFKQLDTAAAINHKCTSSTVECTYPAEVNKILEQYPQYWNIAPCQTQ
jgi:hypothetical protein